MNNAAVISAVDVSYNVAAQSLRRLLLSGLKMPLRGEIERVCVCACVCECVCVCACVRACVRA